MEEIKKEQKEKGKNGKKGRQKNKFKVYSVLQYSIVGLHNRLSYDLGTSKRRRRDAGLRLQPAASSQMHGSLLYSRPIPSRLHGFHR
jgi:hypothetical protein